ncbi:MAG: helix-turn-helix domain-containing protein [Desulfobulbaceae bacterium]|jgi:hypothetical protein|nr:helix-turn-helix domain-containing protein [Desulfobulbaceae bacterium]
MKDIFLSAEEAGKIVGRSPRTIRRWCAEGIICGAPATGRPGSGLIISEQSLRQYIAETSKRIASERYR